MSKYIEWNQPYDSDCDVNLICRLTVEDAIKAAYKALPSGFHYSSDSRALEDFMTVHWAYFVEE